MNKKLFPLIGILSLVLSCALQTPIGLSSYSDLVVDAVPTTFTSARAITADVLGPIGPFGFVYKILIKTDEPGNIIGESMYLDSIIDNLNLYIAADNTVMTDYTGSVELIPVAGSSVTVPFFGLAATVDYAVSMDTGGKKSAYKIESGKQTIVQFHNGTPGEISDYSVTYGVKDDSSGVQHIDLWNALIGINADGSFNKSWAFEIHTEGTDWFEINHNSSIGTYSMAGQPNGYFLVRGRESDSASGNIERIDLWQFDGVTNYTLISNETDIQNDSTSAGTDMTLTGAGTSITKPVDLDDALWLRMITHINTNGDPDSVGIAPTTILTDFNDSFLGF